VSNPAAEVRGLRQAKRVPKALDTQEVYRLQRTAAAQRQLVEAKVGKGNVTPAVVNARRDEAVLNLLLYTGLRVSEAAALHVADVVLNNRSGKVNVRPARRIWWRRWRGWGDDLHGGRQGPGVGLLVAGVCMGGAVR